MKPVIQELRNSDIEKMAAMATKADRVKYLEGLLEQGWILGMDRLYRMGCPQCGSFEVCNCTQSSVAILDEPWMQGSAFGKLMIRSMLENFVDRLFPYERVQGEQ